MWRRSACKWSKACCNNGTVPILVKVLDYLLNRIQGAHWATVGDEIEVAANPSPEKSPVAYVHPSKYVDYRLNPDLPMADRCVDLLRAAGLKAKKNLTFDWIHDTYLILIRMFPDGCPPTTIISMNARYDPHYHVKVGDALSSLRDESEKVLLVGTGGAVHNWYRNQWSQMLLYRDNFGMEHPEAGHHNVDEVAKLSRRACNR